MADHWHLTCTKSSGDKVIENHVIVRNGYEDREIGIAKGLGYSVSSTVCDNLTHLGAEPFSRSHGLNVPG